jgi:hypothetical protein
VGAEKFAPRNAGATPPTVGGAGTIEYEQDGTSCGAELSHRWRAYGSGRRWAEMNDSIESDVYGLGALEVCDGMLGTLRKENSDQCGMSKPTACLAVRHGILLGKCENLIAAGRRGIIEFDILSINRSRDEN